MKTINFKKFGIWRDIDTTEPAKEDVSRVIADGIYKIMDGIAAHDLAFRILRAEGEIEILGDDETTLNEFFANHTKAWMYGSYLKNIKTVAYDTEDQARK